MIRVSKGMMQALQRYTPEYKEQVLNRAERTWRPGDCNEEIVHADEAKLQTKLGDKHTDTGDNCN